MVVFPGSNNYFHISQTQVGNGSGMRGVRCLAGGFYGHSGSWGSCEKIGSENQGMKKPRFRGGSGAAEVLLEKGILDTLVSQPASGGAWLKANDGSL